MLIADFVSALVAFLGSSPMGWDVPPYTTTIMIPSKDCQKGSKRLFTRRWELSKHWEALPGGLRGSLRASRGPSPGSWPGTPCAAPPRTPGATPSFHLLELDACCEASLGMRMGS